MSHVATAEEKFQHRCETRALLWQLGEFGITAEALHEAVDPLVAIALELGIVDTDTAQLMMARAFAAVRDDLGGWRP